MDNSGFLQALIITVPSIGYCVNWQKKKLHYSPRNKIGHSSIFPMVPMSAILKFKMATTKNIFLNISLITTNLFMILICISTFIRVVNVVANT